jgi:uncharacterized membrane protein YjgN (DUF898 family)
LLVILLAVPFLYGVYKAMEWRWWISGVRFGDIRFESTLLRGALASLYWKVIGWCLLIFVLFMAYLFAGAALIAATSQTTMAKFFTAGYLQGSVPMIVLAVIGYLTFILTLNVVLRIYLLRDIWVRLIRSTTVHHIEAAANVAVSGELANAIGEGLADGLDVVGF